MNTVTTIDHARNTDSARIRPFFMSLFGLSPMNADMSVFTAPQVRPEVRHRYAQIETPVMPGICREVNPSFVVNS